MKTINAKRIAAVAASLLMGLAFAGTGGVTWSNIPIINNQGQPVVQVVVGSTAQPSDGVVAANIAAVLGNLAFTSVNVTATPTGLSNVHCVVTTPTCTLTNQQVWFNERGFSTPSGSYGFTALIGSVLNGAVQAGIPQSTKTLQGAGTAYAYPETNPLATSISPPASPWGTSGPSQNNAPTSSNGGGLTGFSTFTSAGQDNVLEITSAQLPSLISNWGTYGESVNLWLTGFPVYDQASATSPPTPNLAVAAFGGAYQVVFNKPIPEPYSVNGAGKSTGNTINNAQIKFLGKNWTILNATTPTSTPSGYVTSNSVHGGKLALAQTLTPISTVYVGHNVSSGGFTVSLTDLGQPNSSGVSQASVNVYYNGTLTNTTQIMPPSTLKFQVSGHSVYVKVNQTFAGLYAYQKWAKIQLYSNLLNISDNTPLNATNAPGWQAFIYWQNTTTSGTTAKLNNLQSIVALNKSASLIVPGGTLNFVGPNMTAWQAKFVGDTLGQNYDPVTFTTSSQSGLWYQNQGTNHATAGLGNINNLTNQPGQLLTVSSTIPSAFTATGLTGATSTLTYDLTPYKLNIPANTEGLFGAATTSAPANIVISSSVGDANIINPTNPLTVTIVGYGASGTVQSSVTVATLGSAAVNTLPLSQAFFNVTDVYMNRALPYITINVVAESGGQTPNSAAGNANQIAQLVSLTSTPQLLYTNPNYQYQQLTSGGAATYNQQNGQTVFTNGFVLTPTSLPSPVTGKSNQYFLYQVNEYNVPSYTSSNDVLEFGIYNSSTAGAQSFAFSLNQSASGTKNNMTYIPSTGGSGINAPTGFITERGSRVASISPGSVTINIAKVVDTLQFVVGPLVSSTGSNTVTTTTTSVGPVGIGQQVPGFANLTVSKVNATCTGTLSSSVCTPSNLSSVGATPSVTSAVVPVHLDTATTPLVVLDSNANSASTLIVVGSKYVNSVAGQIFAQNPSLNSSFGPSSVVVSAEGTNRILVAGYTANQTVQAGNQFINDLLQAAGVV